MTSIVVIRKAGAAYVPIDTDFPSERINHIREFTGSGVVVSSRKSSPGLLNIDEVEIIETDSDEIFLTGQPTDNLQTKVTPDQLAYVIYTSGSTGKRKGVMIEHRSLVDYVFGLEEKLKTSESDSFALVSTIATDLGNTVIYSSLLSGGTLHLFTKESVSNIEYLHHYFANNTIDCLKIVPSHWKALSTEDGLLLPKKLLVFGGEALPSEIIEEIRLTGTDCKIINHYGPTETTIGKLLHVVDKNRTYGKTIPVGKAFSNTQVYVLSKDMQLCPVGSTGRIIYIRRRNSQRIF
jgi:non-ribosomal peptide synthetase component F